MQRILRAVSHLCVVAMVIVVAWTVIKIVLLFSGQAFASIFATALIVMCVADLFIDKPEGGA